MKVETWIIIHTSDKTKRLTHIYTKDDNKEKTRVQYCMEIEEIFVNFVYPQRGSSASNKYNILHAIHQSEVRITLNALHQSKSVNAWKASLLNIFRCIECLRRRGKLFHAKEPEKERLVLKISILALGKSCLFP